MCSVRSRWECKLLLHRDKNGILELIMDNLQIQPIVFSTDSFRTSPEQDSPSTMTSEMFVMMTDKQTKPEGSSGAKGLQLVLSLHPSF